MLGARRGYGSENLAPFDLSLAVIGTGLWWGGWFGFNGGSALGANSRASMAIVVTHLAASAGAVTWMALEWWTRGKPSVLGMISGAVAGLGTITPASGFVLPMHGIVIGVMAGGICFWTSTWLKSAMGYDDSLDVFGVHGVGVTPACSGGVTFLILKLIGDLMPLRVSEMDERLGLDVSLHGEALQ
jgi:Amt family ammonium transporter